VPTPTAGAAIRHILVNFKTVPTVPKALQFVLRQIVYLTQKRFRRQMNKVIFSQFFAISTMCCDMGGWLCQRGKGLHFDFFQ
jgi:hypothetical protein